MTTSMVTLQELYAILANNIFKSLAISFLIFIAAGLIIGDGTPSYSQYKFIGDGKLLPWLKRSTADRWRLHKLEPEAYEKYSKKGIPWRVTFWGLRFLVLPPKYLKDLRTLARSRFNLAICLSDVRPNPIDPETRPLNMESSVGTIPIANNMEIEVVSKHLNGRLPSITPLLHSEATHVFANELGQLPDFESFPLMDLSAKLVHYISNRILVGPELCRSPEYRAATQKLNMSHAIFGSLWNSLPLGPWRKGFYRMMSTPYRWQIQRTLCKFLIPVIEERMHEKRYGSASKAREDKEKGKGGRLDAIQLMVDMRPASPRENDSFRHAIRILHLHFASTGSTISLVHHTLFMLLSHPQYMSDIRDEIGNVVKRFGDLGNLRTLGRLHLLDSFIRETLRFHIPSVLVSLRIALKDDVSLHDGFTVKKGTRCVFPAQSVHFDPENYDDPRVFNGFRFSSNGPCVCDPDKTGEQQEGSGRVKAETLDEKYLPFGHGRQACPGRFFALQVTKIIIAKLLLEYDVEWAETPKKGPTDLNMEGFWLPRKGVGVRVKSRG